MANENFFDDLLDNDEESLQKSGAHFASDDEAEATAAWAAPEVEAAPEGSEASRVDEVDFDALVAQAIAEQARKRSYGTDESAASEAAAEDAAFKTVAMPSDELASQAATEVGDLTVAMAPDATGFAADEPSEQSAFVGDPAKENTLRTSALSDLPGFDNIDSEDTQSSSSDGVVFGAAATNFMTQDALDQTAREEAVDSLAPDPFVSGDPEPQPLSATPITTGAYTYGASAEDYGRDGRMGVGKKILIALAAVVIVLVLVYVGVSVFFMSHFMPNTTVNGENVSGMSVSDLAAHIKQIGDQYTAHVTGDGLDIQLNGPDIGLVYDGDAYSAEAQKQIKAWAWPVEIMNKHEYQANAGITYDQAKLEAILDPHIGAINANATPPTNANMSYNATTRQFDVVPEQYGTAVERNAVVNTVSNSVAKLKDSVTLTEAELVQPALPQSDVRYVAGLNKANSLLSANIPFNIAGKDAYNMEPNVLAGWLSLNDEGNVIVNQDAVKEWTQGTLSDAFDTIGMTHRYIRPDGKEIEVTGGTYGWVVDGEALSEILTQNLQNGNTAKIEVPMKQSADSWTPGGKEWPNRYIDVDLSEQYVRMYDENNNLIWETPCVSGNPIYGGGTDEGVYYIYLKASPMELVGLDYNGDGEPDYRTPVTYWMPFDGGEGLHDASWRGSFGDSIYTYDGSHGCVNLPYYAAEELYGITNVGDVVIVHW